MTAEVRLLVRVEDDPTLHPPTASGVSVHEHIDGQTRVIGVRHVNVDPCRVGDAVLGLLRLHSDA